MNRLGLVLTVGVLALAVGVLAASGAFLPFVSGPGYHPSTDTPAGGVGGGTAAPSASPTDGRYDRATVTVVDGNGTELGELTVAVADTPNKRYVGLSKTESLPEDRGMLFTYEREGNHTYVMREMDFGLDIVYVGSDGTIRTIHQAPKPPEGEDGNSYRYPGRGQYVLEVNYGWTTRHDVTEGDRIEITGL